MGRAARVLVRDAIEPHAFEPEPIGHMSAPRIFLLQEDYGSGALSNIPK